MRVTDSLVGELSASHRCCLKLWLPGTRAVGMAFMVFDHSLILLWAGHSNEDV